MYVCTYVYVYIYIYVCVCIYYSIIVLYFLYLALALSDCVCVRARCVVCGVSKCFLSKFFRDVWLQVRFSGAARLCRAPKNVLCSAKPQSCAASHLLLCSCRRVLVTCILVHMH